MAQSFQISCMVSISDLKKQKLSYHLTRRQNGETQLNITGVGK
jgi:hypothetical protein